MIPVCQSCGCEKIVIMETVETMLRVRDLNESRWFRIIKAVCTDCETASLFPFRLNLKGYSDDKAFSSHLPYADEILDI